MAHRQQPVANKLCAATWVARDVTRHRERLGLSPVRGRGESSNGGGEPLIQSVVDARAPYTLSLRVDRSAKRAQMADEIGAEVDRQNALLLAKMSHIVLHGQGRAHAQAMGLEFTRKGPRSLNSGARERETARIGADNAAILRRLTDRKPVYERREWQAHSRRTAAYLDNLREKPLPADVSSAAARSLIPLPRFLRDPAASGSATDRRPPHAYLHGNYSSTFSRTQGDGTFHATQPHQSSHDQPQHSNHRHTRSHGGYSSGSQTARGASAGAPNYVLYQPLKPNRTGVSRQHGVGDAAPRMLEPLASRPPVPAASASSHTPTPPPPRPHTLLLQSERSFFVADDDAYEGQQQQRVVISVYELGALAHTTAATTLSSSRPSSAASQGHAETLWSAPVQESLHSLLFKAPAVNSEDPAESRHVQVPWSAIRALPEVRASAPGSLEPAARATLALTLMERLQIGSAQRGYPISFSTARMGAEEEERAVQGLIAHTQQQQSQQSQQHSSASQHSLSAGASSASSPPSPLAADVAAAAASAPAPSSAATAASPATPPSPAVYSSFAISAASSNSAANLHAHTHVHAAAPAPAPPADTASSSAREGDSSSSADGQFYFDEASQQYLPMSATPRAHTQPDVTAS